VLLEQINSGEMQMKIKSITFIVVLLSCVSANVFAQKWAVALEVQQNKITSLQTQITFSTQKIFDAEMLKGINANLNNFEIQNMTGAHLQAVNSELLNLLTQQMLFELISDKNSIINGIKIMKARKNQLIKEFSFRENSLIKLSQSSKDNETTRYIFEARDLVKSTQEMINASFKY
jgi:hypothetical protein